MTREAMSQMHFWLMWWDQNSHFCITLKNIPGKSQWNIHTNLKHEFSNWKTLQTISHAQAAPSFPLEYFTPDAISTAAHCLQVSAQLSPAQWALPWTSYLKCNHSCWHSSPPTPAGFSLLVCLCVDVSSSSLDSKVPEGRDLACHSLYCLSRN